MNKKIYILATVHQYESGMPTVMLDVFTNFNTAKHIAISNADSQKKIEKESIVSEWVHDEQDCKIAKYYLPTFDFVNPLFIIETRSIFRERSVITYRAVFEQVQN